MTHDTPEKIYLKMVQAVDVETDDEQFYSKAQQLGHKVAQALGREKRSQITGLESLANSTKKVSDVFDYIKLRTARQREWQRQNLGQELLQYLEVDMKKVRGRVCDHAELASLSAAQQQEVYMRLIRAFIAHVAAQYEFSCMVEGERRGR